MTTANLESKMSMNTRSVRGNIARESGGFAAGELASMGVSLGVVAVMDKVIPKSIMDKATSTVAKVCITPYLDVIERNLAKCKLEECQVDETKTREERANRLAKMALVFGTAYFISLAAKLAVRKWVNAEPHEKVPNDAPLYQKIRPHIPIIGSSRAANIITFADEGVHIGSFVYLNTMGSNLSDEHIKKMSKTLEKLGVSPQKAKEVSTMVMVWEVPNFLGMLAGGGAIFGKHAKGWGVKDSNINHSFMDVIMGDAKVSPLSRT